MLCWCVDGLDNYLLPCVEQNLNAYTLFVSIIEKYFLVFESGYFAIWPLLRLSLIRISGRNVSLTIPVRGIQRSVKCLNVVITILCCQLSTRHPQLVHTL